MRCRGRHQNDCRGRKTRRRGFKAHLTAALLDQQDLKEISVTMSANGPIMNRRARRDRFNMDEIENGIVRRIAVEMKSRQSRAHPSTLFELGFEDQHLSLQK